MNKKKVNYNELFKKEVENISRGDKLPTLLLHACCGPCFTIPYEKLKGKFKITVIYNNSNIYPEEEYYRRLNEFKRYLKEIFSDVEFIELDYDNETYNLDLEPYAEAREGGERCKVCFTKRLSYGYEYAAKHGFDYFGTVMTISRYKNAETINSIGYELEKKYPTTKWLPADFKKENGYEDSLIIIKEHEMYLQEYCGCKYSYQKYLERASKK